MSDQRTLFARHHMTLLVAGHRIERLGDSGVLEHLPSVLKTIKDAASPLNLRILTGITHGTDTAACAAARELGCELHLIVPGSIAPEQMTSLGAARAVALGGPLRDDGRGGYREDHDAIRLRDQYAIEFADMLLVVWDGNEPRGHAGGTVRLIYQAAMRAIPVIWLHLDKTVTTYDVSAYEGHWKLKFRSMSQDTQDLRQVLSKNQHQGDALESDIAQWVLNHLPGQWPKIGTSSRDSITDLEIVRRMSDINLKDPAGRNAGMIDALLQSAIALDKKGASKVLDDKPLASYACFEWQHPTISKPTHIAETFERADILANVMGKRHRDSIWVVHLLASLAVFGAVMGVLDTATGGGYFWPALEGLVLIVIMGTVWLSKRRQWHRTWLQARWLAEMMRGIFMAYPVMAIPPLMKSAVPRDCNANDAPDVELWIAQNILREQGIPADKCNPVISRKESVMWSKKMLADLVKSQQIYHSEKNKLYERVYHRLHGLTVTIFALSILAVIAHFWLHSNMLIIFTVVGPALGSALHGIQSKLEYARLAMRSEEMEKVFRQTITVLESATASNDTSHPPHEDQWTEWLEFLALAEHTVEVLSSESEYWKGLVEHQSASLPA